MASVKMRYSTKLLQYFYNTKHVGSLANVDNVVSARVGTIENGDILELYLQIKDDEIRKAQFKAYGSPAIIAGGEYLCCILPGKTLLQAKGISNQDILSDLQLSQLKIHIAALMCRAINQCIQTYGSQYGKE